MLTRIYSAVNPIVLYFKSPLPYMCAIPLPMITIESVDVYSILASIVAFFSPPFTPSPTFTASPPFTPSPTTSCPCTTVQRNKHSNMSNCLFNLIYIHARASAKKHAKVLLFFYIHKPLMVFLLFFTFLCYFIRHILHLYLQVPIKNRNFVC